MQDEMPTILVILTLMSQTASAASVATVKTGQRPTRAPKLVAMPYREAIHYEVGNFMKTPFPNESFKAITSISVIEHGFAPHGGSSFHRFELSVFEGDQPLIAFTGRKESDLLAGRP